MKKTNFTSEQFNAIYPKGIENHYWNKARNKIIHHFLKKHCGSNHNFLEIGCARGIVVQYLNRLNIKIIGAELGTVVPLKQLDKKLIYTETNANDLPEEIRNRIDYILLLDIIEHIKNPTEFIQEIMTNYPNLKGFIFTVPARQELFSNYDEFNNHYLRYDKQSLINVISDSGMIEYQMSYFFHSLYIPAFLSKWLSKRNTTIKAPSKYTKHIHFLLCNIFFTEYKIFPSSWLGTSLIALAKLKSHEQHYKIK